MPHCFKNRLINNKLILFLYMCTVNILVHQGAVGGGRVKGWDTRSISPVHIEVTVYMEYWYWYKSKYSTR